MMIKDGYKDQVALALFSNDMIVNQCSFVFIKLIVDCHVKIICLLKEYYKLQCNSNAFIVYKSLKT